MPTSPTSYLTPPGILIWRSRYHIGFQLPLHHVVSQNSHLQVPNGPNIQHLDDRSRNQDMLNDDVVKMYELIARISVQWWQKVSLVATRFATTWAAATIKLFQIKFVPCPPPAWRRCCQEPCKLKDLQGQGCNFYKPRVALFHDVLLRIVGDFHHHFSHLSFPRSGGVPCCSAPIPSNWFWMILEGCP